MLLSRKMVFYPAGSLQFANFHVVWEPKKENERPGATVRNNLHWAKSARTEVSIDELFQAGVIAFPINVNWKSFLAPSSHEAHLDLISYVAEFSERTLNLLRFYYCRIDLPETLPERAGLLKNKQFSAALFYSLEDNESYIIAGDVIRQSFVTGLGLEIDDIAIPDFRAGDVGNIAQHALQMHTDALEAPNDTAKFINLINLLEYVADPFEFIKMQKTKGKIARHVAKNLTDYEKILEDFKFLTRDPSGGKNDGLRHNIIHLGKRLEDLLSINERKKVLIRMNRYAAIVIRDLLKLSDRSWSDVEQLRETYGKNLGLIN